LIKTSNNVYDITKSMRLLGRPRRRWVDNIRKDLRRIGWDGVAQDRDQWRALVNTLINFWVS
jgi:hypothetical protein